MSDENNERKSKYEVIFIIVILLWYLILCVIVEIDEKIINNIFSLQFSIIYS